MQETTRSLLTSWQNFYVIIGSATATLTGLMFVVITLTAGMEVKVRRVDAALAAFNTPTVVHFCAALLVAVILCAPWPMLWPAGLLLGLCGLAGMIYVGVVLRRTRRQTEYQPVLEDWLWHTIFPLISYTAIVLSSILLLADPVPALFIIGAATVLFLFIGIHNAWDTVTYLAFEYSQPENRSQDKP